MNIRQVKSPEGEAAGISFPKFLCRSAVLFPCQGGAARTEKMLKEYGGAGPAASVREMLCFLYYI